MGDVRGSMRRARSQGEVESGIQKPARFPALHLSRRSRGNRVLCSWFSRVVSQTAHRTKAKRTMPTHQINKPNRTARSVLSFPFLSGICSGTRPSHHITALTTSRTLRLIPHLRPALLFPSLLHPSHTCDQHVLCAALLPSRIRLIFLSISSTCYIR